PLRHRSLSRGGAAARRPLRRPSRFMLSRAAMTVALLRAENLVKHFSLHKGFFGRHAGAVHAVDGISFELGVGKTLALVGESGCGKSTAGRLLLRLIEPDAGRVWFDGADLVTLDPDAMRARRRALQI